MSKAPERIWAEPGMPGYLDEPNVFYTVEYVRADRIDELEAKLKEASLQSISDLGQAQQAYQAQLLAEAKLARAVEFVNEMVLAALQSSRDTCIEIREELDFKVGTGNATEAQTEDWECLVQDIAALNRVIDYYGG